MSSSWGLSETAVNYLIQNAEESPGYAQAFNEIFQEAAAQGISNFTATGDYGAYQAVADIGTTNLAVGNPADSPYVTAAGGTTLPTTDAPLLQQLGINISQQRAWGWDYLFPLWQAFGASSEQQWAEENIGGSNGGYSVIFPEPWYQYGVRGVNRFSAVPWFTPIDTNTSFSFNPSPPTIMGQSNGGRAMPDLSLNADPITGYTIYSTLFGGTGWSAGWGGTSFVAPQLNGIATLIDQQAGGRVGFWNPAIYQFAQQPNSPLTPMDASGTSNDNLYYSGTPGTVYNPAIGLGTPDVAALARAFTRLQGPVFGDNPGSGGSGDSGSN
jgi:subtilase family serine protease